MRLQVRSNLARKISAGTVGALLATTAAISPAHSKTENLFAHSSAKLEAKSSRGADASRERLLRDGDARSTAPVVAKVGEPAELVYSFGGATVTPRRVRLKTKGLAAKAAKIEVLVSTLSATGGFKSLRVEPISKSSGSWQSFEFEQSAAKWVMIKITPFRKDQKINIAELELNGHVGIPVTTYKFNESPADALSVLETLGGSVDVSVSADEKSLFADAADGTLDDWSFAEASLLSSGILDKARRAAYLKKIDDLERRARKRVPANAAPFKRGQALLTWLHTAAFKRGYVSQQTDVFKVFDSGTFNCVSSATLYNILAKRMGLDVRGIEVPDHAFSILYDGTNHADIETTTKRGFNPTRNRAGLNEFQRTTGFVYIADKHRSKRREFGDAGMVAVTYYNHGVGYTQKKQYAKALVSYFKALNLDPKNKSAVKNVLSVLTNWSSALLKAGDFDKSLSVLKTGLSLAPKDYSLRHNHKVVWQRKAMARLKSDGAAGALDVLKSAYNQTQDTSFLKMQAWVFSKQSEERVKARDWEGALAITQTALTSVDPKARKDVERWQSNVFLRWSSAETKARNFEQAIDVLERARSAKVQTYKVNRQLGYAVQEWSKHIKATEGDAAARKLVVALNKRFPGISSVQNAVRSAIIRTASVFLKSGDYEKAIAVYAAARKDLPKDHVMRQNHRAIWNQWAQTSMKARDWKTALDIFGKAHAADPNAGLFKQNIAYVVQEWSREVAGKDGAFAGEKLVKRVAGQFPKISSLKRAGGRLASQSVLKLLKASKFEQAETELLSSKPFFTHKTDYDRLAVNVYYRWAQPLSKAQRWKDAVVVYQRGYRNHPSNWQMRKNLVATWHGVAKPFLDKKQWAQAIAVYKRGLKDLPGESLFVKNIKYSEYQLKKAQ